MRLCINFSPGRWSGSLSLPLDKVNYFVNHSIKLFVIIHEKVPAEQRKFERFPSDDLQI